MIKNINLKEENNKTKIVENPETLAAVHTHTGYCLLVNKINMNIREHINRGRTMLNFVNIGLPLGAFAKQTVLFELNYKSGRAGPVRNFVQSRRLYKGMGGYEKK